MGHEEAARRFVSQLDAMFGFPSDPKPASDSLARHEVVDWSTEPWVGGAYSTPSLGAEEGDRAALARPVNGVLFWAGEAAHTAVNPCMQAALDTGERAAKEVLSALRPVALRSKL
jgi:monoamine oxidase